MKKFVDIIMITGQPTVVDISIIVVQTLVAVAVVVAN